METLESMKADKEMSKKDILIIIKNLSKCIKIYACYSSDNKTVKKCEEKIKKYLELL